MNLAAIEIGAGMRGRIDEEEETDGELESALAGMVAKRGYEA